MNKYYLEFKTWREGKVTIPGQYKIFGETNDYRSRKDLSTAVPHYVIQSVFLSFNEKAVDTFLNENVAACEMAVIVEAADQDYAIQLVNQCLGPIALDGIILISEQNKAIIEAVMGTVENNNKPQQYPPVLDS